VKRVQLLITNSPDPLESAKLAGLRYVSADSPGIARRRNGRGFVYITSRGELLRDARELQRIKSLVIPPAWSNVWICSCVNGHLQALGIDAKGRKQYLYHAAYREIRDATKFNRMAAFGETLPVIRARVDEDLKLRGLPRQKVVATVVHLLEKISVRIGNAEYVRANDSFGITTLRDEHVKVDGNTMRFRFRGKSGKDHDIRITDRRLAKIVALCQDLPGQELFQYIDGGEQVAICSDDVNCYLKEVTGEAFTAKDFRTWNGSKEALNALYEAGPAGSPTELKRKVAQAVKCVSATLRNTAATCRKYYIHPAVLDAYDRNTLFDAVEKASAGPEPYGLVKEEMAMLKIIATYSPAIGKEKARAA
jgi:DNA topoisomerase-1